MRSGYGLIAPLAAGALVLSGGLAFAPAAEPAASSSSDDMSASTKQETGAGPKTTRPLDLNHWPTVGTTMRMDPQNNATLAQMRQVQMEPRAFASFEKTHEYPDGANFGVTFYSVKFESSDKPAFYHADKETFFGLEVLDRTHPDGRRFYLFMNGAKEASALPAGNQCASCHNSKGAFKGTFAQYYPVISNELDGARHP